MKGSCPSCIAIAERHGVRIGSSIELRAGHRGTVIVLNHASNRELEPVFALVTDEVAGETVLFGLSALAGRVVEEKCA